LLQGKIFGSDDEVITVTEAYFETKGKSFYKEGIKSLEERWNVCLLWKSDYVDDYNQIFQKKHILLVNPGT